MALLALPFLVRSSVNTAKPANLGVSSSPDTEVATTTDLSQILQDLQSLKLEPKNRPTICPSRPQSHKRWTGDGFEMTSFKIWQFSMTQVQRKVWVKSQMKKNTKNALSICSP